MKNSGFSLIEILIAIALVAVFIPAIATIFSLSLQSSSQGEKFSQAYSLAQQGMEEKFNEKTAWLWTSSNPTNGITTNNLPNNFTRNIEIVKACRDLATKNLCDCSSCSEDNESRRIIVTVSWPERDTLEPQVKLEAYVTKH